MRSGSLRFRPGAGPLVWALAVLAMPAEAATFVPDRNLSELARRADAVVLARALESSSFPRGNLVFTRTELEVEASLSGGLARGSRITVEVPGGSTAGRSWLVAGAPAFRPQQTYLLCLARKSEAVWIPSMLAYGVFEAIEGEGGMPLLAPVPEADAAGALERPDGEPVEPMAIYERDLLIDHLASVLVGSSAWDASAASASADLLPAQGRGGAPPAQCSFFEDGGRFLRWQAFDSSGTATIFADSTGDPSIGTGVFRIVQDAMNVWMQIPRSSVNLLYAGAVEAQLTCSGGDNAAENTIVFNDPCSDMEDLQNCTGVLAFGGPLAEGARHTFDGASWLTITGWIVVVNNGSGCLGEPNYRIMMAHELGHGLGFGHVNDASAIMFASCCHNPSNTDLTCLRYTYPARDAQNLRPVVSAGNDVALALGGNKLRLRGTASDDGVPAAPGKLTTRWQQVGGPGSATFTSTTDLETTVTLPRSGVYFFRLTAFDGELYGADVVEADVSVNAGTRQVAVFTQGENGYKGTTDTFIQQSAPSANNSGALELSADSDDPGGTQQAAQALLRFDDVFGAGPGQVPPGAQILSATLDLTATNLGNGATLHRMNVPWEDAEPWSAFGGDGIQAGGEALSRTDATAAGSATTERLVVTSSVASWSQDPCANFGWAFLPSGTNGWDFYSSEGAEPPRLTIEFSLAAGDALVADGDAWRYWKGTSPPPAEWNRIDFDDAAWLAGTTTIGYGDGDDSTELADMRNGYVSVYLRKSFQVSDAAASADWLLSLIVDDGAVAYVNGQEVGRVNLDPGPVSSTTEANRSVDASPRQLRVPGSLLRAGTNVLAASVHNSDLDSSDLSFTAVLFPVQAARSVQCGNLFQRGDVSGDGGINLTDPVSLLEYLFRGGRAPPCADAADADDNGRLLLTDAVAILGALFKGSGPLPAPGIECGTDPTADDLGDCATEGCRQ